MSEYLEDKFRIPSQMLQNHILHVWRIPQYSVWRLKLPKDHQKNVQYPSTTNRNVPASPISIMIYNYPANWLLGSIWVMDIHFNILLDVLAHRARQNTNIE